MYNQKAHALMDKLKISHDYRDGPARKHEWGSGWVPEAVRLLMGLVENLARSSGGKGWPMTMNRGGAKTV
jgi:hypothetical protein